MKRTTLYLGGSALLLFAGGALAQPGSTGTLPGDTPSTPPITNPDTTTPDDQQHRMSPQSSDGSQAGNAGRTRNAKGKNTTRQRDRGKSPSSGSNGSDDSSRPDTGSSMP